MNNKRFVIIILINTLLLLGLFAILIIRQNNKQPPDPISTAREITALEVASHSSNDSCWTIIGTKVYDVSPYINTHPDDTRFTTVCGKDGTDTLLPANMLQENEKMQKLLSAYYIGILAP